MDWPVLKHLDTLIGLAVVMLIVSTAVVGINQAVMAMLRMRAKQVSQMLGELIGGILPELAGEDAHYLAERLLRHPRIGRAKAIDLAQWTPWKKTYFLPGLERGEAILRHEVIGLLLEWCLEEGGFRSQEAPLTGGTPVGIRRWLMGADSDEAAMQKEKVEELRAKVRAGLAKLGVNDPAAVAAAVRKSFAEKQAANPAAEAHTLFTQAIAEVGLGDFGAKVFAWYDNTMERTSEFFSVRAKGLTIIVSFLVALGIQLDSIDLWRRLTGDDKLRAALVAKAGVAQKAYEEAVSEVEKARKDAKAVASAPGNAAKDAEAEAAKKEASAKETLEEARKVLDGVVQELRDPKAAVLDNPMLLEEVAVLAFPWQKKKAGERWWLVVDGTAQKDLVLHEGTPTPRQWVMAIGESKAPVDAFVGKTGLVEVVARSAAVGKIALWKKEGEKKEVEVAVSHARVVDWGGHGRRLPGVLLTALFLSLGAPFWYDQLKNLLKLRSLVLNQDEKERTERRTAQDPAVGASAAATAPAAPAPNSSNAPNAENVAVGVAMNPVEKLVKLSRDTSVRSVPQAGAAVTRMLEGGTSVIVLGESAAQANGRSEWYKTVQGDYLRGEDTEA